MELWAHYVWRKTLHFIRRTTFLNIFIQLEKPKDNNDITISFFFFFLQYNCNLAYFLKQTVCKLRCNLSVQSRGRDIYTDIRWPYNIYVTYCSENYSNLWKCMSLWQARWPHLTSDTVTFWKPLWWATKASSLRNHTKDPELQQLRRERDKRRMGGKQPWEHNCPPIQSDWIHNVLTGCIAACHGSALHVCLVLSGQERGERISVGRVCLPAALCPESVTQHYLSKTDIILELQSKGSVWPRDELGLYHFGWFCSIELGYIQLKQSKLNTFRASQ